MAPSPFVISKSAFQQAVSLYPSLAERVYASKLKKDPKNVTQAIERDHWRFEELPTSVKERRERLKEGDTGVGLTKDEVERLVQWKM